MRTVTYGKEVMQMYGDMDAVTHLVCTEEEHNKFYIITIDKTKVTTHWGRLGVDGKKKVTTKSSDWSAESFAHSTMQKKAKKGYYQITEDQFKRLTAIAKAAGTAHKVENIRFVEVGKNHKDGRHSFQHLEPEEIGDPDKDVGLLVDVRIRKKGPDGVFTLLFDGENAYETDLGFHTIPIRDKHPIMKKIDDIKAAIGEAL
jgi:predicted DNA-binding WGR domain protein